MNHRFLMMWIVALVATTGSLYLSEWMGYVPCSLCWYQRVLMYPIVLFLTVALIRKEWIFLPYVRVISMLGAALALYHYLQQRIPSFADLVDTCKIGIPCRYDYLDWFGGWITIPALSFFAFSLIFILSLISPSNKTVV